MNSLFEKLTDPSTASLVSVVSAIIAIISVAFSVVLCFTVFSSQKDRQNNQPNE